MNGTTRKKPAKENSTLQPEVFSRKEYHHSFPSGPSGDILTLQRSIGNQAVNRLLQPETKGIPMIVQKVLKSGRGQLLDPITRAYMESRFNVDFGSVKIHADPEAARSAQVVNAEAYTIGNNVVFGAGEYRPETVKGKRLLAHELVHVLQQHRGGDATSAVAEATLDQDAEKAASMVTSRSVAPVVVNGTSEIGLAKKPRSLQQTVNFFTLTDEELEAEIAAIQKWLQENPASSAEREELSAKLATLLSYEVSRGLASFERQYAPAFFLPGMKLNVHAANVGYGLTAGFLAGAQEIIPRDAYERLEAKLGGITSRLRFQFGSQIGIYVGMAEDLGDNIAGLAHLAKLLFMYGTPVGAAIRSWEDIQLLWSEGLKGYIATKEREAEYSREIIKGVWEFIKLLESDPAFLMEHGWELGYLAGQEAGKWVSDEFLGRMTPFQMGKAVGTVEGYVVMEIVLLFIGPEEWALRGAALVGKVAEGSRLANAILKMIERVPTLRKLYEARKLLKGAEKPERMLSEVAKLGQKTSEGEKIATAAEKGESAIKMEKAAAEAAETERALTKPEEAAKVIEELPKAEKAITKPEPVLKPAEAGTVPPASKPTEALPTSPTPAEPLPKKTPLPGKEPGKATTLSTVKPVSTTPVTVAPKIHTELLKKGYTAEAIESLLNAGIDVKKGTKLYRQLLSSGETTRDFINMFYRTPGFDQMVLNWAKGGNSQVGARFIMRYCLAKLKNAPLRFEWPVGLTISEKTGGEAWARYVDIVIEGNTKINPGSSIFMEFKSWTGETLKRSPGKIKLQLVRDRAFFDPDKIRWVFDSRKVSEAEVLDAFIDIISKDDYLSQVWGGTEAELRRSLSLLIEMF